MKVLFFILTVCVIYATSVNVQQCPNGKSVPNLESLIKIGTCTKAPCRLRRKTLVDVDLKFTPDREVKKLTNTVYANIVGLPFPFIGVDNTNACGNIYLADGETKAPCPLKAGQQYVYKTKIDILEIYPRIKVTVHWGLTTPEGNDVVCFEVPARITN